MDYVELILTGYTNSNSQNFLDKYFIREFKKAEKENYSLVEFFTSCIDVYKALEENLLNQLYKRKNELYLMKGLAESNQLTYSKNDNPTLTIEERRANTIANCESELNRISESNYLVHLQTFTNNKFTGRLSYNDVLTIGDAITKAYKNIAKSEENTQQNIKSSQMKNSEFQFDLSNYELNTGAKFPYFKILLVNNDYNIYEGAIGTNRFRYFKVPLNSNTGKLCASFVEKYYVQNAYRHTHYEEGTFLLSACENDAIEKDKGFNAYLKYWNDCHTKEDKTNTSFHGIIHLEALKLWYSLQYDKRILENEKEYINETVKEADLLKWKNKLVKDIEIYLDTTKCEGIRRSAITMVHAEQLKMFYDWVSANKSNNESKASGEDYIKPELINRLIEIESKAHAVIETFKANKIKCAAWVELLMDKKYFTVEHKKTIRKSCIGFAKERYNVDISSQMQSNKKNDRAIHKLQMNKHFE